MLKTLNALSLLICFPLILSAQIRPQEKSELNYRLIAFTFPTEARTQTYLLEIAKGNYYSVDSFKKNIIQSIRSKHNNTIAEVPYFGCLYTWRISYIFGKQSKTVSTLFHFKTGIIPEVDTNITHLRISYSDTGHMDAFIFLDGTKVLYNIKGKPVWYMPPIDGKTVQPQDIKITPQGTITFIADGHAFEINYDGTVLWKTPDKNVMNEPAANFNHEFTRLNNGHYLALKYDQASCSVERAEDCSYHIAMIKNNLPGNNKNIRKVLHGEIIEFDDSGKIVWCWNSEKYYEESGILNSKLLNPWLTHYNPASGIEDYRQKIVDIHENSFYFDEIKKILYVSCKNLNSILKIKYPEGTLLNIYGLENKKDPYPEVNKYFSAQHAIKHSCDGRIFLFNNNHDYPDSSSTIEIFKEPDSDEGNLEKIWEYPCSTEIHTQDGFPAGGNVIELSDKSIFVSTAAPDNKLFIINLNKEILWSAAPERWSSEEKKWVAITEYRASIIENRKLMELLIIGENK